MSNVLLPVDLQDDDVLHCAVCGSSQLEDPVLLKCLHSACRSCADGTTVNVTCPVCEVATDTSAPEANLLISALAHRSWVLKNVFSCSKCVPKKESVAWCYKCQYSLCEDCEGHHKSHHSNHEVTSIGEHTVLSELYRPYLRLCSKHNKKRKLVCFTCEEGLCFKCAHDCYTANHVVHLLDSSDALDLMKEKVACAKLIISNLSSADQLLEAHLGLPEEVANAMKASQESLWGAKRKAIDSISGAYDTAEKSLFDCWEILETQAERLCKSAESLKKRLVWTNKYSELALRTEDVAALLPQLNTLCSCASSLLDQAKQVKPPIDPLKLVSIKACLPPDLDTITSEWIGKVALVSDNFDGSLDDIANEVDNDYYARRVATLSELDHLLQEQKKQQQILQRQRLEIQQQEEQLNLRERKLSLLEPLRFNGKPRGTFPGGQFFDVAVTPHGRLLVAALHHGLKEYDAASLCEIATWKPEEDQLGHNRGVERSVAIVHSRIVSAKRGDKNSGIVCTVDALADGRAVVGLHCKLVVLLRRDAESIRNSGSATAWRIERCIVELQASPRRLSSWNDRLLAVLEDRYDENAKSWRSGPLFLLLSLSDKDKLLNRQKLDYDALSIALTDRVVVVASDCEVVVTDATCYVVDCYSHAGVMLWRHSVDGGPKIMSVCSDSLGRVMYAAKWGSVVALSVDDGRELITAVVLDTKETEKPYAIALDRATQRLMALISEVDDEPIIITIFSVV